MRYIVLSIATFYDNIMSPQTVLPGPHIPQQPGQDRLPRGTLIQRPSTPRVYVDTTPYDLVVVKSQEDAIHADATATAADMSIQINSTDNVRTGEETTKLTPAAELYSEPGWDEFGAYVDSDEECEVEEVSEDRQSYIAGQFYPTCIADESYHGNNGPQKPNTGRYRVIHKLGRGGFSTVWLAYDQQKRKHVALKILSSTKTAAKEFQIRKDVAKRVLDQSRLVLCQDTFLLKGSHGYHRVLVLPLQGPNFREASMRKYKPISATMSWPNNYYRPLPASTMLGWCTEVSIPPR